MKRLNFLVNRGENNCFMVHGLEWAFYAEGSDWTDVTKSVLTTLHHDFPDNALPSFLDFRFPDGKIISLCA